ncbi:MAG TPA: outer membrane protein assembly factor BamD [Verrucomicrobiae bacterium]|nr:outer membrane protein assembly factor BamD [Verrucomicrobiae bacterium]
MRIHSSLAVVAIFAAATAAMQAQTAEGAKQDAPKQDQKPAAPALKLQPGEYDLYNAALVDLGKKDFAKAITDLDAWSQKFPNSDYKNIGKVKYIQAYDGAGQPDKAMAVAAGLLTGDLDALFPDPKDGPPLVVQMLVAVMHAITTIPAPTADEIATAQKAANLLLNYNRKAEGYSDAQWKQLHTQVDPMAKSALYYVEVAPAVDAMKRKDYDAAEAGFRKALQEYPDNASLASDLATVLVGEYAAGTHKEKFPEALYLYARAAAIDPAKGGVTKEWQSNGPEKLLNDYYTQYHGSKDGLDDLKALAVNSPTPPAGFSIKTGAEIEKEKSDAFAAAHPELARWLEIKKLLTNGGEAYFKDNMADAGMPPLKGKIVGAKPACNSKELLVALSDDTTAEVTLKLDTPIKGKPEQGEISFEGAVARAFTASPFNLTMDIESAKIQGLEKGPCGATPPPRKK